MLVPNIIHNKLVHTEGKKAGDITEQWEVAFSQLFSELQTNYSNEGLVVPSQPSFNPDNVDIIRRQALVGTFLFDSTNGVLDILLQDGNFYQVQTNTFAQTAISYAAKTYDYIIGISDTSASRTITLPEAASANLGKPYLVKDQSGMASINNIIINVEGGGDIDGATTAVISADYGSALFYSNGEQWFTY